MEKLEQSKMNDVIKAIGGNEPSSANHLPSSVQPLAIKAIDVDKYEVRDDKDDPNKVTASGDWVRVTFEDGGVLSLNGILRSPDLTWAPELAKNEDRINALANVKLHFMYQESLTSRSGRPYKRTHFVPQTIGATPKK